MSMTGLPGSGASVGTVWVTVGAPASGPPLFWSGPSWAIEGSGGRAHLVEAAGGDGQVAVVDADEVAGAGGDRGRDVRGRAAQEVRRVPRSSGPRCVLLRVKVPAVTTMPPPVVCAEFPVMVLSRIVVLGPSAWMPPPMLAELLAKVLFWTNSVPWPFSSP